MPQLKDFPNIHRAFIAIERDSYGIHAQGAQPDTNIPDSCSEIFPRVEKHLKALEGKTV